MFSFSSEYYPVYSGDDFNQVCVCDVTSSCSKTLLQLCWPVTLHDKWMLSINNNGRRFTCRNTCKQV
jgi:hypothetical protein